MTFNKIIIPVKKINSFANLALIKCKFLKEEKKNQIKYHLKKKTQKKNK